MKKTQKGITLVALVITIIVLLILAVVAIGAVRDSGVIGHAQNSADKYNTGKAEEESMLGQYEEAISQYETDGKFETNGSGNGNGEFDTEDIVWTFENSKADEIEISYIGNAKELTLNSDEIKCFKYEWVEDTETGYGDKQLTDEVVTIKLSELNEQGYWIAIYVDAEDYCNVESLTISPNVMNLKNINIEFNGIKSLTLLEGIKTIPGYMCSEEDMLTNVSLPTSLETIGQGAFMGCSKLTQLNIPGCVTSVAYGVFQRCTDLKKINYGGTMATWNSFGDIGLTSGAQVICSDGTITIQ